MRTTYNRESKTVKDTVTTGAGASKVYIPKLWYYEYFMFVSEKEVITQEGRHTEDFNTQDNEHENQQEANSQEQTRAASDNKAVASTSTAESTSPPPPRKKARVTTIQKKQEQLIDVASALLNSKQDQWEMMGLSFGMQLWELDAEQQAISQKLMSDVLCYRKMKKLTHFSTVQLSLSPQPSHFYSQPSPISSSSYSHYSPAPFPIQNQETLLTYTQLLPNTTSQSQPSLSQRPTHTTPDIQAPHSNLANTNHSGRDLNEVFFSFTKKYNK